MAKYRSYFAKANKGKAASVFFHNLGASLSNNSKKAEARRERERKAAERRRNAERRKREAQARRESALRNKRHREFEKNRILQEKLLVKKNTLTSRIELECENLSILISESLIAEIYDISNKNGITPSQLKKNLLIPRIDHFRLKGLLEFLKLDFVHQYSSNSNKIINSKYIEDEKLVELAELLKPKLPITIEEIKQDKRYIALKKLSNDLHIKYVNEIERKIEEEKLKKIKLENYQDCKKFFISLREKFFKEDFDFLNNLIDDRQFSIEELKNDVNYSKLILAKENYIKEINNKLSKYISLNN